ncbi:MAG: single-stranded-DNA-specific exonuclease RecJ [Parvibaculales bacterium]
MNGPQPVVLGVEKSAAARKWVMRQTDERLSMAIAQRYGLPEAVARLVASRHVPLEEVPGYLEPKLSSLMPDPYVLKDMEKAAQRLCQALQAEETVAVFGDYDVDGATSSALLVNYFQALGKNLRVYIPDRMREGYGPNVSAFETLHQEGVQLIITVDCGTMAHEALDAAENLGMEVIVADHHQTGTEMPNCFALVNPKRPDDESGLDYLAAVGVTFMLVVALNRRLREIGYFRDCQEPDLLNFLDVVALGTVCDVVPLTGVNRAFVTQGLKIMSGRRNIGLRALADMAKLEGTPMAFDCGFKLGPRINAGGRVGASDLGARLLTTQDLDEAAALALRMEELNRERRDIGDQALARAEEKVSQLMESRNALPPALVLSDHAFHPGIIGIVAGRLKDKYRRPSFVISLDEQGNGKGSARSVPGVDAGRLVAKAVRQNIIAGGGGHAMAAGVTLEPGQTDAFEQFLADELGAMSFDAPETYSLDAAISTHAATRDFYDSFQKVGPFGADSPEPRFVIPGARVVRADIVGENHVRCTLSSEGGRQLKAIAFASVDEAVRNLLLKAQAPLHIAGNLRADDWRGRRDVQFMIQDVAPA